MRSAVVIKSYRNGICLRLNEEIPFEQLLEEIAYKFSDARGFFGNSKIVMSLEGRELTEEEEICILETIKSCSDLNVVCIAGKDKETERLFIKTLKKIQHKSKEEEDGQFYKGSLRNKEQIEIQSSLVLLGDVYPGSAIFSTRNIIILGSLYGKAYAGLNGEDGHYVVALEMEPEKITIGDFKYNSPDKQQIKGAVIPKVQPKIAYVKNEMIVFEPLTKELPEMF